MSDWPHLLHLTLLQMTLIDLCCSPLFDFYWLFQYIVSCWHWWCVNTSVHARYSCWRLLAQVARRWPTLTRIDRVDRRPTLTHVDYHQLLLLYIPNCLLCHFLITIDSPCHCLVDFVWLLTGVVAHWLSLHDRLSCWLELTMVDSRWLSLTLVDSCRLSFTLTSPHTRSSLCYWMLVLLLIDVRNQLIKE